jgi:hypothetical protein
LQADAIGIRIVVVAVDGERNTAVREDLDCARALAQNVLSTVLPAMTMRILCMRAPTVNRSTIQRNVLTADPSRTHRREYGARRRQQPSTEGYERPEGLKGAALIIGFGRIGQIVSQFRLARTRVRRSRGGDLASFIC